ncbi:MAG: response regulator transcription factor [Candidatus Obscuribacterales bacterium]|nr:response regulator transcription factor [Candidatus Obscuribacterales bacterium]
MAKILVIEDDPALAESLTDILELQGHRIEVIQNGEDGLACLKSFGYDLAIIDWQLPGLCGDDICRRYRGGGGKIPIMMLTTKSADKDKVIGLDAGADDYLPKPFNAPELEARVRALLRRSTGFFGGTVATGQATLDTAACTVTIKGRTVKLQPIEYALFEFLMRHPNNYFTTDQLLSHVWHDNAEVSAEALRTCVKRLRSKLDVPGETSVIETHKGWGYKLSETVLKPVPTSDAETQN